MEEFNEEDEILEDDDEDFEETNINEMQIERMFKDDDDGSLIFCFKDGSWQSIKIFMVNKVLNANKQ